MPETKTVGAMVVEIKEELTALVKSEVALAKLELKDDVKSAGLGAGMLVGAAVFGMYGFLLLLVAGALALAIVLPWWAGFLIMAGLLLVVAGLLALVAKSRLQKIHPPERTIATAKGSLQAVRGKR